MSSDGAIAAGLRALWEQDLLLDFTIDVEGRSFRVNKCVMSAVSDYFRAMVTAGLDETLKDSVKLKAVSVVAMEHLIHFVYKDNMELTKANVAEVLDGAVYLQMHSAITVCTDFILDNLDATLCYKVLSVFQNYSLQDGISKVRAYIKANTKTIVAECDPGVISYDECCFIINNWQEYEVDLFYFVKKWLDTDHEKRDQYIMDLMSLIRFCLMTREELGVIAKRYLVHFGPFRAPVPWFPLFDYAIKYHDSPAHQRVLYDAEQTTVRREPAITVFCAESDTHQCFISDGDKGWRKKAGFRVPKDCYMPSATVEVNNFLIVVNGTKVLMFDSRTLTWTELAPRKVYSKNFAMVHRGGYLYILGGILNSRTVVDTVERYNFQTNEWSSFTTLPDFRFRHAACVYQDSIYISGGQHTMHSDKWRRDSLDKVDCLDLNTLEWQSKAPMLTTLCDHKMDTMKRTGGEVVCVLSIGLRVEYYDPSGDQWSSFDLSCGNNLFIYTPSGVVITKGNTMYFIDDYRCEHRNNNGFCAELTIPEEGNKVSLKQIKHFSAKPPSSGACGGALAIPCKYRRPERENPKKRVLLVGNS